ncbi:hypothetical protein [Abyssisolibacter fermentans]|uniref:hypothetical protein n=1 Tax=Abyssisolibacter fermentans TaxID=1766203 RepID=UPI00082E7546|nr:hypothetical protein [Abyssisolibacter fermentans]
MHVWIKFQNNKKIISVISIELSKKSITGRSGTNEFGETLGKYDSPERAEDIFNEICEFIAKGEEKVFNMPIK